MKTTSGKGQNNVGEPAFKLWSLLLIISETVPWVIRAMAHYIIVVAIGAWSMVSSDLAKHRFSASFHAEDPF